MAKAKIIFHGGVGTVTGANFLFQVNDGEKDLKIMVDCGMFQGSKIADDQNRDPFPYDPATVHYLFVTHAHLDHIGRIPKLVRDGFKGVICSTPPTKDISAVSLIDSLGVLEKEAKNSGQKVFYEEHDVLAAGRLWQTKSYREQFTLSGNLRVTFRDAGHILGSSMIEITNGDKTIMFTGDLGNSPTPLLPDTDKISNINYLVMESVYGDRVHENRSKRKDRLEDVIENTMKAGGTLMIPAFSIERTQEIIYEIESMMEGGRIPSVPVYLDSPLAIKVTDIYKKYENYWNRSVFKENVGRDGLLNFPNLKKTLNTTESRAIGADKGRKIILAGSGMSNGGRIIYHEKHYLSDPRSTLLIMGYQSAGSLGRQLEDGARLVRILGSDVHVAAKVEVITGYSAHKDSDGLLEFADQTSDTLKKVFVVMGEPKASFYLVQRLRDYLGLDAVAPEAGQSVEIDF